MLESMLLLLLALGGSGSPAASPALAPGTPPAMTGVWRGTWVSAANKPPIPVEAVLAAGKEAGSLVGVVVSGAGRDRRTARLSGRYDSSGAQLSLPSGGALRLSADGRGRLIGEVTGGSSAGFGPGEGALELTRVRR
jgi:hypothetical protein